MFAVKIIGLVCVLFFIAKSLVFGNVERLPNAPNLEQAVVQSPLPQRLAGLSITEFELVCDSWSQKVGASFEFVFEEGRKPVWVPGSRSCEKSGTLVRWSRWNQGASLTARENYKPELVISEVDALVSKAGLQKNAGNRNAPEIAKQLHQAYAKLLLDKGVRTVEFRCNKAEVPYQYAYSSHDQRHRVTKELKMPCRGAHQNFDVVVDNLDASQPNDLLVLVHQYNAVDPDAVVAAVGEYLDAGPVKMRF
jgi:hypothetical protein